ncbi:MAG: stage 0 sporulation family protein [Nitrospinaceae bacterium]
MNVLPKENSPVSTRRAPPPFVIGIRVRDRGKSELFDPGSLKLRVGATVVVESAKGTDLGVVASNKILNFQKDNSRTLQKVLRIANENDFQAETRREKTEQRARKICAAKIEELDLPMNLSRVVHLPSANKTIFFFTAEGRVDFRQLIKELASNLRHRIELKQVGVRDEARVIGGKGMCGESLCCSTFLKDFSPVTIRMAKDQGLALNPSKISGVCGRLMCCLQYEHGIYKELIKDLPKVGSRLNTPDGHGKVIKNEILDQKILVRLEDESIMTYHLSELKEFLPAKKSR